MIHSLCVNFGQLTFIVTYYGNEFRLYKHRNNLLVSTCSYDCNFVLVLGGRREQNLVLSSAIAIKGLQAIASY